MAEPFNLKTADPKFDPKQPVRINGYTFQPSAPLSVDDLVRMISTPDGEIYPFSYAANMMGALGVNPKLVEHFHRAAQAENLRSYDRHMILHDFSKVDEKAAHEAAHRSFLRLNGKTVDVPEAQKEEAANG